MAAAAARTDAHLQLILDLWSAWEARGIDGFLAAAGDGVEWSAHMADNAPMTTQQLRAHYARQIAAGERIHARAERFEVFGDHVLVEGRLRIDAPGRMADKHIVWVYAFDEDELRRAYACTSRRQALESIGS